MLPAPDWYEDPEFPGQLRYWDGHEWTEHRAERAEANSPASAETPPVPPVAKPPKAPKPAKPPKQPRPEGETSFTLVVAGVLGSALALILFIAVVVVWVDSYNSGQARGEQARESGVDPATASEYCKETAGNTSATGSAAGYWDLPWVWGCKRGLG